MKEHICRMLSYHSTLIASTIGLDLPQNGDSILLRITPSSAIDPREMEHVRKTKRSSHFDRIESITITDFLRIKSQPFSNKVIFSTVN